VPAVIVAAIATFFVWSQYGPEPRLAHALVNAVAVLIIACPCALGIDHLFFVFIYNVAGVPIAAGSLYPSFGVLLSAMIASAAMTFSSVSVIGNALRLRGAAL
jgi:cation transport ATPase